MKKVKIALCLAICTVTLLSALPVSAANESTIASSQTTIHISNSSIRADRYQRYYKTVDGVKYKRKYNLTQGRWEGDWVKV